VENLEFGVWGFGSRALSFGFLVSGFKFWVWDLGL
jgi:hypothetical protein